MFQWQSARRTSGEKEGTWQEKVTSSAGEGGMGTTFHLHTRSHLTSTLCQWCVLLFHLHCISTPWTTPPPSPHPPMFTSTPSTLLVVQYWCSGSQRATLGSEWNRKSLGSLRTSNGQHMYVTTVLSTRSCTHYIMSRPSSTV